MLAENRLQGPVDQRRLSTAGYPRDTDQRTQRERDIHIPQIIPARPSYPEALGLRHLAFKVEHIEEVIAFLNEQGIETEPLRVDDFTGEKMTFFFDPDGLPLELHE